MLRAHTDKDKDNDKGFEDFVDQFVGLGVSPQKKQERQRNESPPKAAHRDVNRPGKDENAANQIQEEIEESKGPSAVKRQMSFG